MTGRTALQGVGLSSSGSGGDVVIAPDADVYPTPPVFASPHGVGLGPLEIQVLPQTKLGIKRLEYLPEQGGGDGEASPWFAGLPFLAPAADPSVDEDDDETEMYRRDVIASAGAAAGLLALSSGTASADSETLDVVEMEIDKNEAGFRLTIAPFVDSVLPESQVYGVAVNGSEVGTMVGNGEDGVSISQGVTGTVTLYTDADEPLYANIKSLLERDVLKWNYSLDSPADSYPAGKEITLSKHPVVTEALAKAGAEASLCEVGETSIPHASEPDDEVGSYGVTEVGGQKATVLTVGSEAPSKSSVELQIRVSDVDELLDDIQRRLS